MILGEGVFNMENCIKTFGIHRITVTVLLVIVLLFVFGCTKQQPEEIKIGVIASLTGPIAPYGERLREGAELATNEINQLGGINGSPLKLIIEDAKSIPNDAVFAMKKLVSVDKVPVVIGVIGSSLAMAVAPIAEENEVVLLSTGASTPDYTYAGDYCFRNRPSAEQEVKKMAEVAFNTMNMKKIAILYVNNDYGKSFKDVFSDRFKELGGDVLLSESFAQGSTDVRTQLTKIKAADPNAIYLVGQAIEDAYAARQIKELGINTQVLATIGVETGDFMEIAGDAAEGIIYTAASYNPYSRDRAVKHFEKLYDATYNKSSDLFSATAYDAIHILSDVIESDGYSSDRIKTSLYNIKDYPGASGLTTFDMNGDVIKPIAMKKIKDGRFIYLGEDLLEVD